MLSRSEFEHLSLMELYQGRKEPANDKIAGEIDISDEKMIISPCSYQRREAFARGQVGSTMSYENLHP